MPSSDSRRSSRYSRRASGSFISFSAYRRPSSVTKRTTWREVPRWRISTSLSSCHSSSGSCQGRVSRPAATSAGGRNTYRISPVSTTGEPLRTASASRVCIVVGLWPCHPGRPKAAGGRSAGLPSPWSLPWPSFWSTRRCTRVRRGHEATLNSQAWVDKVLPQIALSSAQGSELAQVSSGLVAPAGQLRSPTNFRSIAGAPASTYKAVVADSAPSKVASAAGLLQACLAARQEGADKMASAVQHLLGGDGPTSAVTQMMSAVADFKVSDSAYQLFTTDLPKLGVRMPPSVWLTSTAGYQPQALAAFATKLLAGCGRSEPHKLHIDAITTNPPALRVQGNLQILSPASTVSVTAVVADLGQLAEKG